MPSKVQVRKRLGVQIAKQKQVSKIKQSKAERTARSLRKVVEDEQQGDVLLRSAEDAEEMDADTFLDGGFEQLMDGSDDDDDDDDEEVEDEAGGGEEAAPGRKKSAVGAHKDQLEALRKSDPEFFKYLQETDKSLLKFGEDDEDEDEDEEDEGEEEGEIEEGEEGDVEDEFEKEEEEEGEVDGSGEEEYAEDTEGGDELARARKQKASVRREVVELTAPMVEGWVAAVRDGGVHRPSLRLLVGAFRAAVRFGDEDGSTSGGGPDYVFASAHAFNLLMQFCIGQMDAVLRRHVEDEAAEPGRKKAKGGAQRTKAGAERMDTLPHWRRHQAEVKSYVLHLLSFVERLASSYERQAEMLHVALGQLHRLVPFLLPFPKLCPKALKALLKVWAAPESGGQQCTLLAYAAVRQLALQAPPPFLDACLKGLYLTYARASKGMSRARLARVVLMSSCVVDLCATDPAAAYQHGFVYIRQLAIHLRNAITKTSEEAYRQVYSWQFVNCLRLWAQVLCAIGRPAESPLRQLVYPLVQICLGTARLLPNIRYAPLRFQCVRTLNQLAAELGVFVPVAPLLLDIFRFAQLSKPPKSEPKEKAPDWAVMIKVSKADAEKRRYQEGMLHQATFLLAEHLHGVAYDIGFPEAVVPTLAALKRLAKTTKITALQQRARRLVSQCEAHAAWLLRKREEVDFSPKDAPKVAAFLADEKAAKKGPLSVWFVQEVAAIEAREAELRSQSEARGPIKADRMDDDDDNDDDDADGDDDDDDEKAKAKRKQKQVSKRERQRQTARRQAALEAEAHEGSDQLATAADTVEDLNMSDLDD